MASCITTCCEHCAVQAYVSRCDEPVWAAECLKLFEVAPGVTMHGLAEHHEVYPGRKTKHFKAIQQRTGIAYEDMVRVAAQCSKTAAPPLPIAPPHMAGAWWCARARTCICNAPAPSPWYSHAHACSKQRAHPRCAGQLRGPAASLCTQPVVPDGKNTACVPTNACMQVFFDNEYGNVEDCSPLGITCVYTPDGGHAAAAALNGLARADASTAR